MKTVFVTSSSGSCPENLMDAARLKVFLAKNRLQIVNDPVKADLLIFNTCSHTQHSAKDSLDSVQRLQKIAKIGAEVIAVGCLTKINPQELNRIYSGTMISEKDFNKFDGIIHAQNPMDDVVANEVDTIHHLKNKNLKNILFSSSVQLLKSYYNRLDRRVNLYRPGDSSIFYIKISSGCLNKCTYCGIRKSRGSIRSKPIKKIIAEFKDGLNRGYRDFSLMGTDLGPQGRDLGYTLTDLLGEMLKERGEYRIGVRNVHPYFLKLMIADIEKLLATRKIWYMGIPSESGSNKILKLMKRNHSAEDVQESVRRLKAAHPDILLRTQMMVGFPTETKQDFDESIKLLNETDFDFSEIYQYSPCIGTVAAEMSGRVAKATMFYRMSRMMLAVQMNGAKKKL